MGRKVYVLPVLRPPTRIILKRAAGPPATLPRLSLKEFRLLVDQIKSQQCDSTRKAIEFSAISLCDRPTSCVLCNQSVKPRKKCSCGLSYVATKSVKFTNDATKADELKVLRNLRNKYLVVFDDSSQPRTELMVPPLNYYTGPLARRMLQTVTTVLDAIRTGEKLLLDKEKQRVLTEQSLKDRVRNDQIFQRIRKKCVVLQHPQKAVAFAPTLCLRPVDKMRYGKENIFRRTCMGRVINGGARHTVGTSGALAAGHVVLPSRVLRILGEPMGNAMRASSTSSVFLGSTAPESPFVSGLTLNGLNETARGECNATRYPVIDKLNIAYAKMLDGGARSTADVPSSQFKYNGGDNDGDAFNFHRYTNGLLANSAYEMRHLNAPWMSMSNGGNVKVEFDSDAKLGLGVITNSNGVKLPRWKMYMCELRTNYFITGNSFEAFKSFVELESFGRERSFFGGNLLCLSDYANDMPGGAVRKMIDTQSVSRLSLGNFLQSTRELGQQLFPFNKEPVCHHIRSNLLTGTRPAELIACEMSTWDILADQGSRALSIHGNTYYQLTYVPRAMILLADRSTLFNPVTGRCVALDVSSVCTAASAEIATEKVVAALLDFARLTLHMREMFPHDPAVSRSIKCEALQYIHVSCKHNH